jgi:hypothetical protein
MSKGGLLATKAQQPGRLIFRTAVEYNCFQLTDTCLLNQSMIFSRYCGLRQNCGMTVFAESLNTVTFASDLLHIYYESNYTSHAPAPGSPSFRPLVNVSGSNPGGR